LAELLICRDCGEEYRLERDKPGYATQCWDCGAKSETTAKVGGNMVYTSKQAPELEIKSMAEAKKFNRQTRRFGAGVTASLVVNKGAAERSQFKHGTWMKDDSLGE
jgi:hypothetical protein